jgi:DNA polymerase/3'-5' exonuclease PolX
MKLNEYYLFDENNKKIKIKSEKDIFKKLNLEFINPENRN